LGIPVLSLYPLFCAFKTNQPLNLFDSFQNIRKNDAIHLPPISIGHQAFLIGFKHVKSRVAQPNHGHFARRKHGLQAEIQL
jgi:hypothetical protein